MSTSFVSAIIMWQIIRYRRCIFSSPLLVRMFGSFWFSASFARVGRCRSRRGGCRRRSTSPPLLGFLFISRLIPPGNTPEREVWACLLSDLKLLSGSSTITLGSDILLKSGSRGSKTLSEPARLLVNSRPMAWASLTTGWYKVWWPVACWPVTGEYRFSLCWPVIDWLENSCNAHLTGGQWLVTGDDRSVMFSCPLGKWPVAGWPVVSWPVTGGLILPWVQIPLELPPLWVFPRAAGPCGVVFPFFLFIWRIRHGLRSLFLFRHDPLSRSISSFSRQVSRLNLTRSYTWSMLIPWNNENI